MERDLFEDIQQALGCAYISDLPFLKKKVWLDLQHRDLSVYPQHMREDFASYVFGFSDRKLMEQLGKERER